MNLRARKKVALANRLILHNRHAAVGFRDDPDASLVREPVSGQNSEAALHAQLVLADVVGVEVAWIERDVINEKSQRVHRRWLQMLLPLPVSSKLDREGREGRSFRDLELAIVDAVTNVASDPSGIDFVPVDLSSAELLHQRLRVHRSFLAGEVAEFQQKTSFYSVGVADGVLLVGWLGSFRELLSVAVFLNRHVTQSSSARFHLPKAVRRITMETKATGSEIGLVNSGTLGSHVQFPISAQRSPLDFLLIEEQVQSGNHHIWSLPKLLRQISLTDDHVPSRVPLVNALPIRRNFLG